MKEKNRFPFTLPWCPFTLPWCPLTLPWRPFTLPWCPFTLPWCPFTLPWCPFTLPWYPFPLTSQPFSPPITFPSIWYLQPADKYTQRKRGWVFKGHEAPGDGERTSFTQAYVRREQLLCLLCNYCLVRLQEMVHVLIWWLLVESLFNCSSSLRNMYYCHSYNVQSRSLYTPQPPPPLRYKTPQHSPLSQDLILSPAT